MTHNELLAKLDDENFNKVWANHQLVQDMRNALRAVVELHKPTGAFCAGCGEYYDACTTIKTITAKLL